MTFSARLSQAICAKQSPVLVGLDPRFGQIPEAFRQNVDASNPTSVAEVYRQFCYRVLDIVAPMTACVIGATMSSTR